MWTENRVTKLLDIEMPIVQAPMAGFSTLPMALAVAGAGGLGSMACAAMAPEALEELLAAVQVPEAGALNLNFFVHQTPPGDAAKDQAWLTRLKPWYEAEGQAPPEHLSPDILTPFGEEECAVLERATPRVASFHFGLPSSKLTGRLKAAGWKIISSATTLEEALWLEDHGCDIVIAQGLEAGGHRGMFLTTDTAAQKGIMALVPQIIDAVNVPVIAAGGIGDGRGIAAAFALGASGVQLGTAFLHTHEARMSQLQYAAMSGDANPVTALTNVLSGRPARAVVNRAIKELGPLTEDAPPFPKALGAIGPIKQAAESKGRADFSAHYCGQAAYLGCRTGAAQLVRDLSAAALALMP